MSSSSVPGTNVAPITFPGIVSGIDYDAIITKLTSLTLEPTNALNAQLTTLNNANLELIKINNLLTSVQTALQNLSNPSIFDAYDATSSDTTVATATENGTEPAIPGTYVIDDATLATATVVNSNPLAGKSITATITSGSYAGQAYDSVPLADADTAITPSTGSDSSQGTITIDGVQVDWNTNQSLNQIINNINAAVSANVAGTLITLVNGVVQITSPDPITIGSSSDQGNLVDVLKLNDAQVNNAGATCSVSGTSNVGGLNETAALDGPTNAGLVTPITSGFFTINGVKIAVSASGDNIAQILSSINTSSAGVTATYDADTNQISLVNNATGPQSIVLGTSADTSNFLAAVGLTAASGATTQVGQQAVVTVQNSSGQLQTVYSGTNQITNAITGIQLNLSADITTPITISVNKDTAQLVSAINTFVSAYNAAIGEINNASAPPVVSSVAPGQLANGGSATSVGGGVLYGNANIQNLRYQLTNLVSGFLGSSSDGGYNSLAQLGLNLDDSFSTITTANNGGADSGGTSLTSSDSAVQSTSYEGTDGQLDPLDTTTFLNALTANPSAVEDLLDGASGLTYQLGSLLTTVTGAPTLLNGGPVGNIPSTSLIQGYENANTDEIQNVQQQITQITDNANSQANALRTGFTSSEVMISELQSEQQELAAALGFTVSSSSSTGSGS